MQQGVQELLERTPSKKVRFFDFLPSTPAPPSALGADMELEYYSLKLSAWIPCVVLEKVRMDGLMCRAWKA